MTRVLLEYYVESRACGEYFMFEKRFDTGDQALAYVKEYGETDYKGERHGHQMRAVERKTITTEKVLGTN